MTEVLIATEKLNDTEATGPDGATFLYLRVSADGQLLVAVAYLRTSAEGDERALALVDQQNAIQQFADEAGYKVVQWYGDVYVCVGRNGLGDSRNFGRSVSRRCFGLAVIAFGGD